jgi:hypothetical protein
MEIRCIIMYYANSASCDHYDDDDDGDGHGRPWQALAAAAALATSCTTRASNQSTIAAAAAAILEAAEVAAAAAAKLRAEVLGRRRWSTGDVRYVTATSAVVTYREASFIVYSVFQTIMHPALATSD